MAIDLGSGNTTRYFALADHADFTLPDGDWTWLALVYPESTADVKYIVSTGAFGSIGSINITVNTTASGLGVAVKVDVADESTTTVPLTHGAWNWIYATRRTNSVCTGQVRLGSSTVVESSGKLCTGTHNSTIGPRIGARSDLTANRMWKGRFSQVALIPGLAMTTEFATELSNGTPLLGMPFAGNIKFLLHGRTASDATIADLISGKVATRFGSSYGTNEEDPQTPYIWTPSYTQGTSTPSGVTGTVAYTNINDVSAATGTTTVTGSSATTNANDTSAATGSPIVDGVSATTNADDISSASGAVGAAVVGTVAYTNVDDISEAAGTTTVIGTAASTNVNDTSSASGTTTVTGSSATTNANDVSAAVGEVEAIEIIGTVAYTNADDVSAASGTTTIIGSSVTTNANDQSAAFAIVNHGTIVEAALTSATATTIRIKKPGIPVGTPDWLKTMTEIMTGRRGNKIEVPRFQSLEFSATPTQAELEALYAYTNKVRDSLDQLINRFDS